MKIYLVRHGETDWNKQKLLQGREDIPLNETGYEQARKCGNAFLSVPINAIISSPLKRAKQTAIEIGSILNIPDIQIDFGLIEKDFGKVSGMNHEQREAFYQKGLSDEAEDFLQLSSRALEVLQKYADENCYENILMVSHGAFIGAALSALTTGDIDASKIRLTNTSINIIEASNHNLRILEYNLSPDTFAVRY